MGHEKGQWELITCLIQGTKHPQNDYLDSYALLKTIN